MTRLIAISFGLLAFAAASGQATAETLKQEVDQSIGARYHDAVRRARAGDVVGAVNDLETLLAAAEGGPAETPIATTLKRIRRKAGGAPAAASTRPATLVEAIIELNNDGKIQKRKYRYLLSAKQGAKRSLEVSADAGPLAVDLKIGVAAGKVSVDGQVKTPKGTRKVQLAGQVGPGKVWKEAYRWREGSRGIVVRLSARPRRGGGSYSKSSSTQIRRKFVLVFKGASLGQVLERVAETGGLKLKLDPRISADKPVDLRVEATSRQQVRGRVCARLGVRCKVSAGVLLVQPK